MEPAQKPSSEDIQLELTETELTVHGRPESSEADISSHSSSLSSSHSRSSTGYASTHASTLGIRESSSVGTEISHVSDAQSKALQGKLSHPKMPTPAEVESCDTLSQTGLTSTGSQSGLTSTGSQSGSQTDQLELFFESLSMAAEPDGATQSSSFDLFLESDKVPTPPEFPRSHVEKTVSFRTTSHAQVERPQWSEVKEPEIKEPEVNVWQPFPHMSKIFFDNKKVRGRGKQGLRYQPEDSGLKETSQRISVTLQPLTEEQQKLEDERFPSEKLRLRYTRVKELNKQLQQSKVSEYQQHVKHHTMSITPSCPVEVHAIRSHPFLATKLNRRQDVSTGFRSASSHLLTSAAASKSRKKTRQEFVVEKLTKLTDTPDSEKSEKMEGKLRSISTVRPASVSSTSSGRRVLSTEFGQLLPEDEDTFFLINLILYNTNKKRATILREKWRKAFSKLKVLRRFSKILATLSVEKNAHLVTFVDIGDKAIEQMQKKRDADDPFALLEETKAEPPQLQLSVKVRVLMTHSPSIRSNDELTLIMCELQGYLSFCSYPLVVQKEIARFGMLMPVDKKRVIVRQGHEAQNWYFVISGQAVETRVVVKDGVPSPEIVNFITNGMTFGEEAILNNCSQPTTIVSRKYMQLIRLGKRKFYEVFQRISLDADGIPDHLQFIQSLPFMTAFPMQTLQKFPNNCQQFYYRPNTVLVADSTQSEWIYIVRSGSCVVYMYLGSTKASWLDLQLALAHPFVNIQGKPDPKVDTGSYKLPSRSKAFTLYQRLSALDIEASSLNSVPALQLGNLSSKKYPQPSKCRCPWPLDFLPFAHPIIYPVRMSPSEFPVGPVEGVLLPCEIQKTKQRKPTEANPATQRNKNCNSNQQVWSEETESVKPTEKTRKSGYVKTHMMTLDPQPEKHLGDRRSCKFSFAEDKGNSTEKVAEDKGNSTEKVAEDKSNSTEKVAEDKSNSTEKVAKDKSNSTEKVARKNTAQHRKLRRCQSAKTQGAGRTAARRRPASAGHSLQDRGKAAIPSAAWRKNSRPYECQSPPVYVEIEVLKERDCFQTTGRKASPTAPPPPPPKVQGLDQLPGLTYETTEKSGKVALISCGAEILKLSKKFFMMHAGDRTIMAVRDCRRIYPTEESIQTRYRLQLAWQLYSQKVQDEYHARLPKTKLNNHGTFFNTFDIQPLREDDL